MSNENVATPVVLPAVKFNPVKFAGKWAAPAAVAIMGLVMGGNYLIHSVSGPVVNAAGVKETVQGGIKILSVGENTSKTYDYLNTTADWKDPGNNKIAAKKGIIPNAQSMTGKTVHVFVPLGSYQNRPQYLVTSPDQIKID